MFWYKIKSEKNSRFDSVYSCPVQFISILLNDHEPPPLSLELQSKGTLVNQSLTEFKIT